MTTLYVTEYNSLGDSGTDNPAPIPSEPAVTTQTVTFTTATASAAFNDATRFVRVQSTGGCHLAFGAAPTATTSDAVYNANQEYWFGVVAGQKVSAVDQA